MKALLIMLLIGMCVIGLRSPEIMQAVGMAGSVQDPAMSVNSMTAQANTQQAPMTVQEFAELSKTDPNAYPKLINSYQVAEAKRSDIDKLMNFLSRGKFE